MKQVKKLGSEVQKKGHKLHPLNGLLRNKLAKKEARLVPWPYMIG